MKKLFFIGLLLAATLAQGQEKAASPAAPKQKAFVIVLRLVPRLYDDKAWTETDNATVGKHFARLKAAVDAGQVVLAGRTDEPNDKTFGLIILTAPNETAAREFMNGDPCVTSGMMTAELHPYTIALRAK